jgi:hypothetical protein
MNKTKSKLKNIQSEEVVPQEDYPMAPPETHFLADRYVVKLPISDPHFESPWELRLHVAKLLKHHIGDEVELTSMKVKKPHLIAKAKARVLKQVPCARAIVTIKF